MFDTKSFAAEVVTLVKGYVQQSLTGLNDSVAALTARTAALESRPAPKDGEPGKDADPARIEAIERAVAAVAPELRSEISGAIEPVVLRLAALEALPLAKDGKDGVDGKDADPDRLYALEAAMTQVQASVSDLEAREMPIPKDGKDGKDAEPVSPEQLAAAVAGHLKANPPKDGESVKGDTGRGVVKLLTGASGNLLVTYSDGTVEDAGPLPRGSDGKSYDPTEIAELRRLVTEQKTAAPTAEPLDLTAPEDVAELVSKAAAILAEPPPVIDRTAQPLVVNVGAGQQPQKATRKTMTLTHNDRGQVVAEILEREVA